MRLFIFIVAVLSLWACREDRPAQQYKFHYDDDKLILVMADLHIGQIFIERHLEEDRDSIRELIRKSIGQIHDVDMDKIDQDISELQTDLDKYQELQNRVEDKLNEIERKQKNKSTYSPDDYE